MVAAPPISGLPDKDLQDAVEYAGLHSWLAPVQPQAGMYPTRLREDHAVFAAEGSGLCIDYKNLFACWDEAAEMETYNTLFLSYTRKALSGAAVTITSPFHYSQRVTYQIMLPHVGSDENREEIYPWGDYWEVVRDWISHLVYQSPKPIHKVLVAGESAADPVFLDNVMELVNIPDAVAQVQVHVVDEPEFASARGAALYARWRQEAPIGCRERTGCEEQRRGKLNISDGTGQSRQQEPSSPEKLEL